MKTILLTGASGFVGINFILDLHSRFNIIALVRQNSDVKIIENKCKIIRYDDNLCEILDDIFANNDIDGVIHLATKWVSNHTPEDIKDIIDSNILFGTYILEAVKKHKIAFFINATSFGMYCDSNRYRPATLYAASKRAFDDIMKYYALVAKSTIFCNLLIFNTFGLHDKTKRLFNLLDNIALNDKTLDMSDGKQIVDYTHIKNVVFGFECLINLILEKPSFCKNKLFTLQSPNRQTLRKLVTLYEKLLGKTLKINWGKRAKRELEITKPFSGGIKLPNWSEKVSLQAGLSDLIAHNIDSNKHHKSLKIAKNHSAKNRKWGGAESRFLKESLALCSVDSTFIFFARATTEANQNKYYVKSSNFAESGDKKDLLRRLPRLDFIKSHNDGIWANYHEYKCDSHNDEKNAILRKNADSSYIAESCKYENKSDSAKTFTRKLHKSPARKVAA